MELRFARLMPEVTISISPARLAALAAKAMAPRQASVLSLAHMHGRECPRAGRGRGEQVAPTARHDLQGPDLRLVEHVDHGGALPRTA